MLTPVAVNTKKMSPTHCRTSFLLNKRKERLIQLAFCLWEPRNSYSKTLGREGAQGPASGVMNIIIIIVIIIIIIIIIIKNNKNKNHCHCHKINYSRVYTLVTVEDINIQEIQFTILPTPDHTLPLSSSGGTNYSSEASWELDQLMYFHWHFKLEP